LNPVALFRIQILGTWLRASRFNVDLSAEDVMGVAQVLVPVAVAALGENAFISPAGIGSAVIVDRKRLPAGGAGID
jgi:hypothetical protein